MDPKELPPDAGSTSDDMPPLDAGASSDEYVEDIDEPETTLAETPTEPDTETETTSEEPPEETQEAAPEGDDDVLKAMLGDEEAPTAGPPEGVSKEDWDAFQKFMKAKAQPQQDQQPVEPPAAPEPPAIEPLTDDELSAAFENPENFQKAISKSLGNFAAEHEKRNAALKESMYNDLDQAMIAYGNHLMARMEQMFYLKDAISEVPEIENYPQAFQVALNKAMKSGKPGDLKTPVREALEVFKNNLARAEAIKKTKKVDVRGKQQAPKTGGSSSRQAHTAQQTPAVDDSAGFLASLYKRSA